MTEALEIRTRHTDVSDVVRELAPSVDDLSIRLPCERPIADGEWVRFLVQLADGTTVFEGVGRANGITPQGPHLSVHLSLLQFDERNEIMYERMLLARDAESERTGQFDLEELGAELIRGGSRKGPPPPKSAPPAAPGKPIAPPRAGLPGAPSAPPPAKPQPTKAASRPAAPVAPASKAKPASAGRAPTVPPPAGPAKPATRPPPVKPRTAPPPADLRAAKPAASKSERVASPAKPQAAAPKPPLSTPRAPSVEPTAVEPRSPKVAAKGAPAAKPIPASEAPAAKAPLGAQEAAAASEARPAASEAPAAKAPLGAEEAPAASEARPAKTAKDLPAAKPDVAASEAPAAKQSAPLAKEARGSMAAGAADEDAATREHLAPPARPPRKRRRQRVPIEDPELATFDTVISGATHMGGAEPLRLEIAPRLVERARALAPTLPDELARQRGLSPEEAVLRAALRLGLASLSALADEDED